MLLKGDYIWYFSDLSGQDTTKLKGIVKLTDSAVNVSPVDEKEPDYKYGFTIEHAGGRRTFMLRVKTQQECSDWVHAIKYEIQQGVQREQEELIRMRPKLDASTNGSGKPAATSQEKADKMAKEKAAIKAKLLAKAQARGITLPNTTTPPSSNQSGGRDLLSKQPASDDVLETELKSISMLPPPPAVPTSPNSSSSSSTPRVAPVPVASLNSSQRKLDLPPRSSNMHLQLEFSTKPQSVD